MAFTDERFLDKYGYILPGPSPTGKPADNAVLFESVAVILGFGSTHYKEKVRACYLKPGLIARWPSNDYDQAAWDDYLGVAAACIKIKETKIPKEILSYGIKHFFIYNTDRKLQSRDWLGRHVHVWVLMCVAAFPKMKIILKPLLLLMIKFFNKIDMKDTSSIQLQWVYLCALNEMGIDTKEFFEHARVMKKAFSIYYHKDHPFNAL
jgi:hypothetical protein